MFNNRRITRPVNPVVLEKNDLTSLNNIRNKSLEQRVISRHEAYIQSLKNKLSEVEKKVSGSDESNDPRVDGLKEQCELQSNLLKQYEEKLVGMVGYIKRLEQGLEKVKELLTNKTNTEDTIDKIPEFDDTEQQTEEVAQEVSEQVSEELTVEKVKEDGDVDSVVSLEIVEQ